MFELGVWALPDDAQLATAFSRKEFLPTSCISSAEPWREQIAQWHDAGVPGTTIHSALVRNHGYEGSYSSVYRLLQQLKAELTPDVPMRLEFKPADAAQVDFGAGPTITDAHTGEIHKTWFFVMTLCWSRHQYVEFVRDQSVDTWLLCHRHAFEWFNGVVARVIIDNPKCAIVKACIYEPEVQRAYAQCAEGYSFKVDPCPPRDPAKKGIVESGVKYVKSSFLPLREFRDLDDANRQARAWVMHEASTRTHGTTREVPLKRFEDVEQALLQPLPDVPPVLAAWSTVTVHRDAHIQHHKALYSVPFALVGKTLWVKATDTVVQLFHQHELVATHPRLRKPGARSTVRDHQPPAAQAWLEHDPQWCLAQSKEIGASCHALILALFNDQVLVNLRGAQGIVWLRSKVGDARLDAACERALAHGSPRWRTVKTILDKGLESQPTPESPPTLTDTYVNGGLFGRNLQSLLIH